MKKLMMVMLYTLATTICIGQADTLYLNNGDTISDVKITKITSMNVWYTQNKVGKNIPLSDVKSHTFKVDDNSETTSKGKEYKIKKDEDWATKLITISTEWIIFKRTFTNVATYSLASFYKDSTDKLNVVYFSGIYVSGVCYVSGDEDVYIQLGDETIITLKNSKDGLSDSHYVSSSITHSISIYCYISNEQLELISKHGIKRIKFHTSKYSVEVESGNKQFDDIKNLTSQFIDFCSKK